MIRALICDLGNVLLHFEHSLITSRLAELLPGAVWDEEIKTQFWQLVHAFESGSIDTGVFLEKVGQTLLLPQPVAEADFRLLWADIFWSNQEFIDLLSKLKNRLSLVMLSNTNPLHIEYARERFPELFTLFSNAVFSFEAGISKPDPEIFRQALQLAGSSPDETLYFDDISEYADAAAALGIHGYQYISIEGASDVLRMFDVFPN
ncbi:MAG: HAD family phosphatase [Bacteroidota bacterium]